jgi:hypothetical protein
MLSSSSYASTIPLMRIYFLAQISCPHDTYSTMDCPLLTSILPTHPLFTVFPLSRFRTGSNLLDRLHATVIQLNIPEIMYVFQLSE